MTSLLALEADQPTLADFGHDVWWIVLVKILGVFVILVLLTLFAIVFERKVVARMQQRIGPNRVGPGGVLQGRKPPPIHGHAEEGDVAHGLGEPAQGAAESGVTHAFDLAHPTETAPTGIVSGCALALRGLEPRRDDALLERGPVGARAP